MTIIVILACIGLISGLVGLFSAGCVLIGDKGAEEISTISMFIMIISIGISFLGIYKIETAPWEYDSIPWHSEKIVAMNDNNLTSGKAYSRRIYINEELYYQYIEELKNGGYQADKVKASITTVYYDNENPRVDWYRKRKKWLWIEKEEPFYKMYVPEGTISDEFSIDLQ